jgi:hypothetical protein
VITVGILYDAQKLMRTVNSSQVTTAELLASFRRLEVADLPLVLKLAQDCQWIELSHTDAIVLSTQGCRIHDMGNSALQLRYQLRDILSFVSPAWAKKIADGRSEALRVMPEAVRQIFSEADLLGEWTDDLVAWWDDIGLAARSRRNERNLRIGRSAERLSIEYEEQRTGRKPKWTCAETNYAGYDLLSVVARDERRPCAIEVKGSSLRLSEARFILSRNEWDVAEENSDYRLHLWLIRNQQQDALRDLRVVTSSQLATHVPTDRGVGEWSTVAIPFAPFWDSILI